MIYFCDEYFNRSPWNLSLEFWTSREFEISKRWIFIEEKEIIKKERKKRVVEGKAGEWQGNKNWRPVKINNTPLDETSFSRRLIEPFCTERNRINEPFAVWLISKEWTSLNDAQLKFFYEIILFKLCFFKSHFLSFFSLYCLPPPPPPHFSVSSFLLAFFYLESSCLNCLLFLFASSNVIINSIILNWKIFHGKKYLQSVYSKCIF